MHLGKKCCANLSCVCSQLRVRKRFCSRSILQVELVTNRVILGMANIAELKCLKEGITFLLRDFFQKAVPVFLCVCMCIRRQLKNLDVLSQFLIQRVDQAGKL